MINGCHWDLRRLVPVMSSQPNFMILILVGPMDPIWNNSFSFSTFLNISLCDSQSFNAIYIFALQYMKFDEYSVERSIC